MLAIITWRDNVLRMKNAHTLETIEQVIQELGGPEAMRKLTRRKGVSSVNMWKCREKFPAPTYTVIQGALREKGKTAPDKLWGMQ
jgi:hypothetical protein